eukprot:SAG11_NODE_18908_length_478_cov_1.490765_1_plen_86_part_01
MALGKNAFFVLNAWQKTYGKVLLGTIYHRFYMSQQAESETRAISAVVGLFIQFFYLKKSGSYVVRRIQIWVQRMIQNFDFTVKISK